MFRSCLFIFVVCLMAPSVLHAQTNPEPKKMKKVNLLPVYISTLSLPDDTAAARYLKEAFSRHKVKLITKAEFDELNNGEVERIRQLVTLPGRNYSSEQKLRESISTSQRFVTNLLTLVFTVSSQNDTLSVTGASWSAVPFPPAISGSIMSHEEAYILKDTCCSMKDNIYAIVDYILYSKWLR